MKLVFLEKEKISKKKNRYYYKVGKTKVYIPRRFVTLGNKGVSWVKFPVNNATLIRKGEDWKIEYKPGYVVYDFFLYSGVGGDVKICVSSAEKPTNYITYVIEDDLRTKGIGKGILLSISNKEPIRIHWNRTGYFMSGLLGEGHLLLFPDGKYELIEIDEDDDSKT